MIEFEFNFKIEIDAGDPSLYLGFGSGMTDLSSHHHEMIHFNLQFVLFNELEIPHYATLRWLHSE